MLGRCFILFNHLIFFADAPFFLPKESSEILSRKNLLINPSTTDLGNPELDEYENKTCSTCYY